MLTYKIPASPFHEEDEDASVVLQFYGNTAHLLTCARVFCVIPPPLPVQMILHEILFIMPLFDI